MNNEDGTKTHVWGIDTNLIIKRVLARSIDLAKGIGKLTKGNAKYIADIVGGEFAEMFEHMRCNPDGSSVYDVHTYTSTAADSSNTYLLANEDGKYMYEQEIMGMYGSYIGEDWNDYIFNFSTDFRMNVEKCAADLDKYIDSVLEYTGAEKVNLYCVSHGGQVGATFLNLYGEKKADKLNNVLLTVPAIGGASIAYGFFTGDIKFDEENLLYFIENGMMFENDYHWLLANENFDFIDDTGVEDQVINIYPQIKYQTFEGFGGAITDAAGYVFQQMNDVQQKELKTKMTAQELREQLTARVDLRFGKYFGSVGTLYEFYCNSRSHALTRHNVILNAAAGRKFGKENRLGLSVGVIDILNRPDYATTSFDTDYIVTSSTSYLGRYGYLRIAYTF